MMYGDIKYLVPISFYYVFKYRSNPYHVAAAYAPRFPIQRKCVVFSDQFHKLYDLLWDDIKCILKKSQLIIHFIKFINLPNKMALQSDSSSGSESETMR